MFLCFPLLLLLMDVLLFAVPRSSGALRAEETDRNPWSMTDLRFRRRETPGLSLTVAVGAPRSIFALPHSPFRNQGPRS